MEFVLLLPLGLILLQYLLPQDRAEAPLPCPGESCR